MRRNPGLGREPYHRTAQGWDVYCRLWYDLDTHPIDATLDCPLYFADSLDHADRHLFLSLDNAFIPHMGTLDQHLHPGLELTL